MSSLHKTQTAMARAILEGPSHVPGDLFEGSEKRVMMAFASHANTVSHARLVALEETFPHARELLSEERFNQLSRAFLDSGHGGDASLSDIGGAFAVWLENQDAGDALSVIRFEWSWLESYRAAEAPALTMQDLGQLDEERLLATVLELHPAARRCTANAAVTSILKLPYTEQVMLVRPNAEIRILPLTAAENHTFSMLEEKSHAVSNLFAGLSELMDETQILPAIITLVGAGAVVKKEQGPC
ncbi:putative DNA-binding domain-containing protein [Altererythrobacter sp. ZODW24]|uniref:HvfC/BufC family peptide modification chaperone n=1 Tax=Altererythrobacter sp. ZODW24 TaxID=2185142 RepID=UPI0013B3808E|nr:putative DNA-binding domain-containing protein [Altererythrobacter sp. ZODW24]